MPPMTMARASAAKARFSATIRLLLPALGARLERERFRNRVHPRVEPVLVVQEVADPHFRVLVLGAPEQRVEGTDLDADPAVHAQGVVDVEAVDHVDRSGPSPLPPGRPLLLVALDVDAPVGAAAAAQHADGAVL